MKLEQVFIGYVAFVVCRFYFCAIREELRAWRQRGTAKFERRDRVLLFSPSEATEPRLSAKSFF